MPQLIVLSAVGTDRPGIVKDLSKVILDCGGGIEESRMTTLGEEFAILLLISGNWHTPTKLEKALSRLSEDGNLQINLKKTSEKPASKNHVPYGLDVVCLEQPGLMFELSNFFTSRAVDICDVSTRRYAAPHTGAPMFAIQMALGIPGELRVGQLRDDFHDLCERLNLDSILEPVKP